MPRKETTPEAPDIVASVEHANVKVTPKGEVTKLVINYTNQRINVLPLTQVIMEEFGH